MAYGKISPEVITALEAIAGKENVLTDKAAMEDYSHDEYDKELIKHYPEAVVKPRTTPEVCGIMKLASAAKIPVTVRGGATGLIGGCVPLLGGISLSFEKMNKVIEVDVENMMAVVQAGTTLREFYKSLEGSGLLFPPHPGDESATIGGVIATNAGGARAVKYGVVRNFVKGLEVVLANGDVIEIGGKLVKNSTGYNLMHLMIGSEGTLGIITKAIISLIPTQKTVKTLIAPYTDLHDAIATVPKIIASGILPMAVEFIEKEVLFVTEKFLDKTWPCRQGVADLMIILDGATEDEVMQSAQVIGDICLENKAIDVFITDSKDKQAEILKIRSEIYEAIKKYTIDILDVVVPRSRIADFVDIVHVVEKKYGMWMPTFGHAADGNVHSHIMSATYNNGVWTPMSEALWKKNHAAVIRELYAAGKSLGGLISGEHGIGIVKKEYLAMSVGEKQVDLMRGIKKTFDPEAILNPGKIFDL
jgi:glycolate oxidase